MRRAKEGFTLIEVMVAVMIISVVIMAMIEMYANNTHIFSLLKEKTKITHYSSFIISNNDIETKSQKQTLYDLVSEFPMEDELRRSLKKVEVTTLYQELDSIDLSSFEEKSEDETSSEERSANMTLYVGKTVLKFKNDSLSLLRLKLQ